jgi:cytochrome P450
MTSSVHEPLSEDVFGAFNRAQGMGSVADPYPRFAELRRKAPVLEAPMSAFTSLAFGDVTTWAALSFEAVSSVLRDGALFSSAGYGRTIGLVMGHTILEMDEPEHHRYRSLLREAFTLGAMRRWEAAIVRPVIEAHVERIAGRGRAELVREVTFPFPVEVIARMIGIPEEDHALFHRLAVELISIAFDPPRGLAASAGLRELFARHLARRRARPEDDLLSQLARAELDGTCLSDEEIFAFLRLLAPAGAETTYRSSSNLLCGLLAHPEQLALVRRDRAWLARAMEEGLRWEAPLTSIQRTATRDVEVAGVRIPAGVAVQVVLGAANRDETRWPDPDRFDVTRPARAHAAFAFGPHTCLGKHLARMETRALLECLFERLPGLRLDPEYGDVAVTGLTFRAPLVLPVVWDA